MISICFVICWSCEQGFYFMFNIGYNVDFNGTFFKVSILMAFVNCTINPFIYLIKYKDYQQALKHCFNCTRYTSSNGDVMCGTISTSTMSLSSTTPRNSNLWSFTLFRKLGMQCTFFVNCGRFWLLRWLEPKNDTLLQYKCNFEWRGYPKVVGPIKPYLL